MTIEYSEYIDSQKGKKGNLYVLFYNQHGERNCILYSPFKSSCLEHLWQKGRLSIYLYVLICTWCEVLSVDTCVL